jgi:hypothetical protein
MLADDRLREPSDILKTAIDDMTRCLDRPALMESLLA